jgi:hypothetical protein
VSKRPILVRTLSTASLTFHLGRDAFHSVANLSGWILGWILLLPSQRPFLDFSNEFLDFSP